MTNLPWSDEAATYLKQHLKSLDNNNAVAQSVNDAEALVSGLLDVLPDGIESSLQDEILDRATIVLTDGLAKSSRETFAAKIELFELIRYAQGDFLVEKSVSACRLKVRVRPGEYRINEIEESFYCIATYRGFFYIKNDMLFCQGYWHGPFDEESDLLFDHGVLFVNGVLVPYEGLS